ncbi:cell division protein SepF [Kitasatospora sp. NBC_01250]|uniref:cell division protein SepF n=1 Tax=unclassified Kitasatospora TaxID=2633591 RepID=UPI002E10488D|nr:MULTISPECIES: cell division protein SepF [unclassified Kitasatospora]WSJ65809.1 cell division protein SepF [Kitasatospora sp. NBC_01302]
MGALRDEHHGWLMPSGSYPAAVYEEESWATADTIPVLPNPTKIVSVKPTGFESARVVGEHIRSGTPVVMDVTEMDDGEAKRMVDFASGLVFGTRGGIERIARRVFLLTPPQVEVMVIDRPLDDSGFYNQS